LVIKGDPQEDSYAFLKATVADCIAAGLFRDEFKDIELTAQLVWAGMHGVVSLHIIGGNDGFVDWRPGRTIAELMVETQLRGMLRERTRRSGHGPRLEPNIN
jgi:hypothetical protein